MKLDGEDWLAQAGLVLGAVWLRHRLFMRAFFDWKRSMDAFAARVSRRFGWPTPTPIVLDEKEDTKP